LAAALVASLALALAACSAPPMKAYAYRAWGFAASFWSAPQVTETPAAAGKPHSLMVDTKQAGREFAILVEEGVRPEVTIDQIGPFFAHNTAQGLDGDVGTMTYVSTAQGVLGREFAVTQSGKPLATIRTFLANDRFYEIVAQSVLRPDDPAVKDFLDSFRITAAPPAVPPPPANATSTNAA
jgi:hypothetical protein